MKLSLAVLNFLLIFFVHAEKHLIKETNDVLVNCVNLVMKSVYYPGDLIVISGKVLGLNYPVVNYDSRRPLRTFNTVKFDVAIVQLEENKQFNYIIQTMSLQEFFNPAAKFVVISKNLSSELLQVSSRFYLKGVIFLETASNSIYGYKPFQNQNSSFIPKDFKYLTNCRNKKLSNFTFPSHNAPKTWRNTTVNVRYNVVPPYVQCPYCESGIETHILDIVSKHLGFNVQYVGDQEFRYWGSNVNGSYTYILGKLFQRKCDMVLGAFHSKFEEHLDFDMTFTFIQDGLFWLVPKARRFRGWRKLALVLSVETYILLLLTMIIVPLICCMLYKYNIVDYFLVLYQTLLEVALPRLPGHRMIYSYILIPFLIVSTVFKGSLIHILSIEHHLHQIQTLEDIVQSNLTITFDHDIARYFKNDNPLDRHVFETYTYCEMPRECINRTAYQKNVVTVDFQRAYEFQLPILYVDSEGKPLLYLFRTPIFPLFIHWYFVKGFPLFPQIDSVLLRLKSSGIIDHICDRVSFKAKIDLRRKVGITSNILGLKEMFTSFILLSLGIILSLVAFFVELCVSWYKKKRQVRCYKRS